MKRSDCYMTFTEALEQYLTARQTMNTAPQGCSRWREAEDDLKVASDHMNALTGDGDPE